MNRTKTLRLLLPAMLILAWGCSKKSDTAPPNNNNNNNSNNTKLYYFRFTLNGVTDTINADSSKAYTSNTNAVLADISGNAVTLHPDMSLRFSLPVYYDTVVESNVLGLAGKTLYFSDTTMAPELEYQTSATSDTWYSNSLADTSYNVKVSSVTFLAANTYQGLPVRTYVITGTCRALMHQTPASEVPLTGSFKMVLVRVNYK